MHQFQKHQENETTKYTELVFLNSVPNHISIYETKTSSWCIIWWLRGQKHPSAS